MCKIIPIKRPTKSQYKKCLGNVINTHTDTSKITNIKNVKSNNKMLMYPNKKITCSFQPHLFCTIHGSLSYNS